MKTWLRVAGGIVVATGLLAAVNIPPACVGWICEDRMLLKIIVIGATAAAGAVLWAIAARSPN